ncbi:MAG: dihydropteroate synthase [Gammaproteobacteria bacterium]|nr:dihydropteroate synthase [Gammaproteobacteria bacterium]MCP4090004.1 dihydropteroate synthase [Gammaproteobacteria bacterium]MCP4277776.1 dihydropteroate synthase [Gammaproteobacteria bacterium]MCP4831668.1 dihydropteroate synthase [Gammaproteobacteria bacterium]MCP4929306.1 dihydropteroate synthase [Gammaproteobacteria bacterium]
MGILNVTPDSFSDGGLYASHDAALRRALEMVEEGADIIDVGGESTRPGATPLGTAEEIDRVVPVIEAICRLTSVPVSVDTSKPEVMRAGAAAGASMLNDVRALGVEGAVEVAAELNLPVCLMHMQGEPRTMQAEPHYADVVAEVLNYLQERIAVCVAAGIKTSNIVIDPGFGFGKTLEHNLALFSSLDEFVGTGQPLLIGVSRKSMILKLLNDESCDRVIGSVTLALAAARKGAHIVRVHDVRQTVDALRIEAAVAGF